MKVKIGTVKNKVKLMLFGISFSLYDDNLISKYSFHFFNILS